MTEETIAAIATPPGRGGVAIVRVSGPSARRIAEAMLGAVPPVRRAVHRTFADEHGAPIDEGLALYFHGPSSFTGEDVLELHCHGGQVVSEMLLARVVALGARVARPGEFSERAFLNDRIDLAQAEAIADLIDSGSTEAARAAVRSMRGEFSTRVQALADELNWLRTYVEAAIDFPDDDVDFLADEMLDLRLAALHDAFAALETVTRQGRLLRDGMTVVIAGRPNAGKSSLLNALAGHDAAIVTDIAGTTRDLLREYIQIDGLPLHVVDTAGLRSGGDAVEQEGIRRARDAMARADRVLIVIDDSVGESVADSDDLPGAAVTIVRNKIDLSGRAAGFLDDGDTPEVSLSAATGAGLEALRDHLKTCMGYSSTESGMMTARRRHLVQLKQAQAHLHEAMRQLREHRAGELVAEELRLAQQALGEITGKVTSDDLLGSIFSSFCIGK